MDNHAFGFRKRQQCMKRTACRVALVVLLSPFLLIGGQGPSPCAQPPATGRLPVPPEGTRAKVLDLALPVDRGSFRTSSFVLVLRFLPSFHPESQIVIRYASGSGASFDYMTAHVSFEQVWSSHYCRKLDNDALANLMAGEKITVAVRDAVVTSWFQELWRAWVASAPILEQQGYGSSLQLDGTEYRLDYYQIQKHLSLSLMGSEIPNEGAGDVPIVQWMNKVRKDVEKNAQQQRKQSRDTQRGGINAER